MECNDKRIFVQVLKNEVAGDPAVSSYYIMKGVRFIYIMCYDICLKDKGDSMGKVTIKIFGIGDGGNTIIRHMLQHRLHGVEYIAVNTNRLALLQLSQEHNWRKADERIWDRSRFVIGQACSNRGEGGNL